jgi:aspartate kinase
LQRGISTRLIDARHVLITDNEFTHAAPLFDRTEANAKAVFLPPLTAGTVVVTQGFIGATVDGLTTTIGRGGSDYSAAIFGAALDAEEIQIWTDVDGVLSADPSILPEARRIKKMTSTKRRSWRTLAQKFSIPARSCRRYERIFRCES